MTTVLYIEDDAANIELIRRYLSAMNCQFISAADGSTGIAIAADRQPDIILLDIYLPDMNGMEVMAHIHAMPALSQVPIVALTTDDSEALERRCLQNGFAAVVHKPVRPQDLLELVGSLST